MAKIPSAPKPSGPPPSIEQSLVPKASAPTTPEAPKKQGLGGRLKEEAKELWDHGRDAIGGMFG